MALAGPLAEFAVSLTIDGSIASQGAVAIVLGSEFAVQADDDDDEQEENKSAADEKAENKSGGKLFIAEEIELGHVSRKTCTSYLCHDLRCRSIGSSHSHALVLKSGEHLLLDPIPLWPKHV